MPITTFENMTLFCKPEQSGKTFLMIQQLIKDLGDDEGPEAVHFIFCDNNLLLTKQTSQRIATDLEKHVTDDGTTYVEFSSRKDNVCRHSSVVSEAIAFDNVRHVVCCTNKQRVSDVCKIITKIANSKRASSYRFKIWVDEADKALTHITKMFHPLCEKFPAVQLNCLTATPQALFKKFRSINVWALEQTTAPDYHGWEDNNLVVMPESEPRISCFVRDVLNENADKPQIGQFWYIPAERKKTTHDEVRDICVSRGFAVFTVNGNGLRLSRPHPHKDITEDKGEELKTQILRMCVKYGVRESYPIALTGNICIGRGISIMSRPGARPDNAGDLNGLFLDYGIVTHYGQKPADISQSAGRLKGNIKDWENYRKPTVFTTELASKIAIQWETKSRRLAQLAFERGEGETAAVTKTQFKTMSDDYEYIKHPTLFDTMDEVREFLKRPEIWQGMRLKKAPVPKGTWTKTAREQCDGYAVSSKLHKLAVQTADLRLTIETAAAIGEGSSLSSTKKGSQYLVLPVYESLATPAHQEKYELRYIKFKN